MGAGASASARQENSWEVSEIPNPEKPETNLTIPSPLVLSITQESLDLTSVDQSDSSVLHYPYHKIKCWSATASYFSFQLGVGNVQTLLKFKTKDGVEIQKALLSTILKFMEQSKGNALQNDDFKLFQALLFHGSPKALVADWMDVADEYFKSRPFRLTAAHSMDLLALIDENDGFVSLDFCCMLHKYILNQESFKLVMNSITDQKLKLNLASRLGIDDTKSQGVTVQSPQDST